MKAILISGLMTVLCALPAYSQEDKFDADLQTVIDEIKRLKAEVEDLQAYKYCAEADLVFKPSHDEADSEGCVDVGAVAAIPPATPKAETDERSNPNITVAQKPKSSPKSRINQAAASTAPAIPQQAAAEEAEQAAPMMQNMNSDMLPGMDCSVTTAMVQTDWKNYRIHFRVPYTRHGEIRESDKQFFTAGFRCENSELGIAWITRKECGGQRCAANETPSYKITYNCEEGDNNRCYAIQNNGKINPHLFMRAYIVRQYNR